MYYLSSIFDANSILQECFKLFGKDIINKNILEICCGNGRITQHLGRIFYSTVALDINEEMLRKINFGSPSNVHVIGETITTCLGDGRTIPLRDNAHFDVVYNYIGFQHMERETVLSYFKEAQRVLKVGGYFIFQLHKGIEYKEPTHFLSYSTWTEQEIKEALRDMELINIPDNEMGCWWIFKKI
jgi:ubiquinone/menaquinone biosynthesis C-methylase UbiE